MRILDAKFKYTPSIGTNIVSTWKKFGFKPTTEAERLARQRRNKQETSGHTASVTRLDSAKRKSRNTLRLAGKKSAGGEG